MTNKKQFLSDLVEIKNALVQFLRHPMTEIKHIPDWDWRRLIFVQVMITATTGALANLIERKTTLSVLSGIFISPILTLITLMVSTLFFYYCFQIFAEKTVSLRRLFTVILFANIPQFIFQMISGYFSPATLIGMGFTAFLLLVGFVENFSLNRKLVIRMIAALYTLFFCLWIWNRIATSRMDRSWNNETIEAPEVHLGE